MVNQDHISLGSLEVLKNGIVASGKYETAMAITDPCHVGVFANVPPPYDSFTEFRLKEMRLDPQEPLIPQDPTVQQSCWTNFQRSTSTNFVGTQRARTEPHS